MNGATVGDQQGAVSVPTDYDLGGGYVRAGARHGDCSGAAAAGIADIQGDVVTGDRGGVTDCQNPVTRVADPELVGRPTRPCTIHRRRAGPVGIVAQVAKLCGDGRSVAYRDQTVGADPAIPGAEGVGRARGQIDVVGDPVEGGRRRLGAIVVERQVDVADDSLGIDGAGTGAGAVTRFPAPKKVPVFNTLLPVPPKVSEP